MLILGLDLSTQSLSAVLLECQGDEQPRQVGSWEQSFFDLAEEYALAQDTLTLQPAVALPEQLQQGQYDQPPALFWRSLDLLFKKMQESACALHQIAWINCSSQQHGQLYFNKEFASVCKNLNNPEETGDLEQRFSATLAYPRAPIWLTSNTAKQVEQLHEQLSAEHVLKISGAQAPLRFSGFCLRWLAQNYPQCYEETSSMHLISSMLAAILCADASCPLDWGSACGTALFDYHKRCWSQELVEAMSFNLAGGSVAFQDKLPQLCSPQKECGFLAHYFVNKYGFSPSCRVLAGSGDNPQTKVCIEGDLLSLGSSFVLMSEQNEESSFHPWANASYDGLARPFSFVCRSNGCLVWDEIRRQLGLSFSEQEEVLETCEIASLPALQYLALNESFPPGAKSKTAYRAKKPQDLAAIIDTTLEHMAAACKEVFGEREQPLFLAGGAASSMQIRRRVAHYWQQEVKRPDQLSAAYGAAYAAWKHSTSLIKHIV